MEQGKKSKGSRNAVSWILQRKTVALLLTWNIAVRLDEQAQTRTGAHPQGGA